MKFKLGTLIGALALTGSVLPASADLITLNVTSPYDLTAVLGGTASVTVTATFDSALRFVELGRQP